MLSHCHITNLAIVKNIDLDLQAGMSVITGETGAGKSILLDAIGLCFGERAESSLIRPGCEKAEIACTFDIRALPGPLSWLKTNALESSDSPEQCIVRRILYATGRSKAYINGSPATIEQLKLLGEVLLQIHGQHQHQLLLKSNEQLRLLDAFADHGDLLSLVQQAYQHWKKCAIKKQNLLSMLSQDTSRLALLRYQVAELNDLDLQDQELEQLDQQQNQLCHAQVDSQDAQTALQLLSDEVLETLNKTIELFKKLLLRHPSLHSAYDIIIAAHIQIQESISDLNRFCHTIESNPEQLHYVEQRLSTLYDMARKHKIRPETLIPHFQKLTTELELLNNADEKLIALDQQLSDTKARYLSVAHQLSDSREKASVHLSQEIEQWLEPLGMPGGHFRIHLHPHNNEKNAEEISAYGLESAQFGVSANPGHPLQPLHKVASGGELSRISLAIQLILAQYLNTPTLIFDEVDVGVGGKIGAIIGQALQTLSQSVQVLCVTHLPQVAAFGKHHINVIKHRNQTDTYTTIEPLTLPDRVEELARMLGGINITQQARDHAKDLLSLSMSTEN